jgi:hypothetical protein
MRKSTVYRLILAGAGVVCCGLGGFAPTSVYFPNEAAWMVMIAGFFLIMGACRTGQE